MSLTKLSLAWKNQIIRARESLVSDIPAGDGKIVKKIVQCSMCANTIMVPVLCVQITQYISIRRIQPNTN
jgi:hypothetical protein